MANDGGFKIPRPPSADAAAKFARAGRNLSKQAPTNIFESKPVTTGKFLNTGKRPPRGK